MKKIFCFVVVLILFLSLSLGASEKDPILCLGLWGGDLKYRPFDDTQRFEFSAGYLYNSEGREILKKDRGNRISFGVDLYAGS